MVHEEVAREKAVPQSGGYHSPLPSDLGYHRAAELARIMKDTGKDIFAANEQVKMLDKEKLEQLMEPDNLLKKGFTMDDIRKVL